MMTCSVPPVVVPPPAARARARRPAWLRSLAAALAATLAGACGSPPGERPPPSEGRSLVAAIAAAENPRIDVLFVIDDSGSMIEEQASLARWARESLFGVLDRELAGRQDLHVGVVTPNLGAGGHAGIQGCEGDGDGGRLRVGAGPGACPDLSGAYLADAPGEGGARERNFAGALEDAFACQASVGQQGCGFEQPLAAALRALDGSVPDNAGFLRDDALLAVIFVTDEDDCSASDGALFSPDPALVADLGPFSSFRCFRWGVTCGDADPSAPGARDGCAPRDDSPYVTPLGELAAGLRALKADPTMVLVAGIMAPREPVGVEPDAAGGPGLAASCSSSLGTAYPPVRLHALLDAFPARGRFASICEDSLAEPLEDAAALVAGTATRSACLTGDLLDADPTAAGLQADCRVLDVPAGLTADDAGVDIPGCAATAGAAPCHDLVEDPLACATSAARLAVRVERGGAAPPAGTHLEVLCRLAP